MAFGKIHVALAAAVLAAAPWSASAQTVVDDTRCLLLSNTFAARASQASQRQIAESTGAFFLGKLDGKVSAAAVRSTLAQDRSLKTAQAITLMDACVSRARRADASMRAMVQPAPQGR